MSPRKIKPLGKRLLVKRFDAEVSKGGILLPDSAQEKPKQGEVVSVSDGSYDEAGKVTPLTVQTGDKVLFGSYAGAAISVEGADDYIILSEDEVLAVIN